MIDMTKNRHSLKIDFAPKITCVGPTYFRPEWQDVIITMQCYITCEGRVSTVHQYQMRFLVLILQQDDELSGKKSPSLSGPTGYFWRKSIFSHVDHIL